MDERGLSRRLWLFWRTWPWTEFASGRVSSEEIAGKFIFHAYPWWRREFTLLGLDDADADEVLGVCARFWVPPPIPPVPDTIRLSTWPFLRKVGIVLSHDGITVEERGKRSFSPWSDVTARIVRKSHFQQGFTHLTLNASGRPFRLVRQDPVLYAIPFLRSADPRVVVACLEQHLGPERIRVAARYGNPHTVDDIDIRIERLEERIRQRFRMLLLCLSVGLLTCVVVLGKLDWKPLLDDAQPFSVRLTALIVIAGFLLWGLSPTILALSMPRVFRARISVLKIQRKEIEEREDARTDPK
jgi:hypothetical protein